MPTSKEIVWLSSYPKSGNTWFRIVLSRLLNQSPNLNYINDIDTILGSPMVANRSWMNKTLGFDSSLLDDDEIDQLRPAALSWYARQIKQTTYIKTHDAYTCIKDDTPLIPSDGCLGAVYFIRNPLDVAVSLAHHAKCPIDWSIHMMGNNDFTIPMNAGNDKQIRQKLLSWSGHVQSWVAAPSPQDSHHAQRNGYHGQAAVRRECFEPLTNAPRTTACPRYPSPAIKVLVLRYEDMFFKPLETFSKGMAFLNIERSREALQEAIDDASFNTLQQHEQRFGFQEKPAIDGQFFRKGIVGDWQNTLNDRQIQRIIQDHAAIMRQYGYLDENNQPV